LASLDDIAAIVRAHFDDKNAARERALVLSREAIRASANAIRAVHRGEADSADVLLEQAGRALAEAREVLRAHPDVFYAGFVQDAQKEYVEACATRAFIRGGELPAPDALEVDHAPYLNGLGEAVGELRRYVLDRMRLGELAECERVLGLMDEVYALLVTMDYPDAMTGGLRRTTDLARSILEKTRGDVTVAITQRQLEQAIEGLQKRLRHGKPGD